MGAEFVFGGDADWPMSDEWGGDAAFVVVMFEEAKGCVFGEGPAFSAEPIGVGFGGVALGATGGSGFGVAAVVGHEEDEGVFENAPLFEAGDEIADGLVHAVDNGGVGGHEVVEAVLLFGRDVGPGLDVFGARGFGPSGIDDSQLLLFGIATVADGTPADFVLATELGDFFCGSLEGEVGGVVAEVEVEGFLFGESVVDELQSEGGPEVGGVPALRQTRVIVFDFLTVEEELGFIRFREVEAACRCVQAAVKAATPRRDAEVLADMPFAGHGGEVTGGFEDFCDGDAGVIETARITGGALVLGHVADSGLMGVKAGEEGGASGATAGGIVELGEAKTASGEGVEVGGGDFGAVTAEISEAHVVNEDDDDVGFVGCCRDAAKGKQEERQEAFHGALETQVSSACCRSDAQVAIE